MALPYTLAAGTGTGVLTMDNDASSAVITDYAGANTISAARRAELQYHGFSRQPGRQRDNFRQYYVTAGCTIDNPGDSVVVLSGTNSYGGGTTVQTGICNWVQPCATGNKALSIGALELPAGILDLNGYDATVSSITVLTGPNTVSTGSTANIINTNANSAVTVTLTYAGSNTNPSTFSGNITDNSGTGGSTTALTVSSGSLTLTGINSYGASRPLPTAATLAIWDSPPLQAQARPFQPGGNAVNNGSSDSQ